jgi:hypothetical protein
MQRKPLKSYWVVAPLHPTEHGSWIFALQLFLEQLLHLPGDHSGSDVSPAYPYPGPENVNYLGTSSRSSLFLCFCLDTSSSTEFEKSIGRSFKLPVLNPVWSCRNKNWRPPFFCSGLCDAAILSASAMLPYPDHYVTCFPSHLNLGSPIP